jgi:hypothetical protein
MQKMSFTYGGKYYQKGAQPILVRKKDYIRFGENMDKRTDLCFPVNITGVKGLKYVDNKILYMGRSLKDFKTGITYFNYDYFFKDKETTKKYFWKSSQAYFKYFGQYPFGDTEEVSFQTFLTMMNGRHDRSPYIAALEDHPKYIREAVKELKPEQFGFNGWN